jgi:peptide/nickel transport system permease protein
MARESAIPTPVALTATRSGLGTRLRRWPLFSLVIVGLLIVCAAAAPVLAPHDPEVGILVRSLQPPAWQSGGSWSYPLGTDFLGRDILSGIIYGTRLVLLISLLAVAFSGALGLLVGVIAGYAGGWLDAALMRLTDAFLSVPFILFGIVFAATFGGGLRNVLIILTITGWTGYARQVRAEVLTLRETDFVKLARVAGASRIRIIARHVLPNVTNTFIVLASLALARVVVAEAALSFLGLGIQPPTPAWGLMLAQGRQYIADAWWIATFPGIALMLTVLAMNNLGDWLRDRLDPKLRQL